DGSVVLTGRDVESAEATHIQAQTTQATESAVELHLTDEGTEKFAEATEAAVSAGESIGIYYDGEFVSVPTVQTAITDGVASITGMTNWEEASNLAATIRIGGLSLELEELNSQVVGAQLGSEAISTSLMAGVIGLILIILFLMVVYRIPGAAAGWALVLYVELTLVCLNAFEITLTLPGIAGIILGIGMAVDANVIIFARMREEIGKGRSVATAIDTGFSKALSAIIDGNVTTLIAAAVLYILGSGTVRGFAQTLALGILLSMITALFVTRLILKSFYALGIQHEKFYGKTVNVKVINFLG